MALLSYAYRGDFICFESCVSATNCNVRGIKLVCLPHFLLLLVKTFVFLAL